MTCTLFAPVPELIFEAVERGREAAGRARPQVRVKPEILCYRENTLSRKLPLNFRGEFLCLRFSTYILNIVAKLENVISWK